MLNGKKQRALVFVDDEDGDLLPKIDLTEPLEPHSKRTERRRRKLGRKAKIPAAEPRRLLDLPYEILMAILTLLRPSEIFVLCRVTSSLRSFILSEEATICKSIINLRYSTIKRCFLRPVLANDLDSTVRAVLEYYERLRLITSSRSPFQHIQAPDSSLICTCLTCLHRWNSLCIVVDFAHWQDNLDQGEPIPMVPRGSFPAWNQELLARNASIVTRSLTSPLWYARILEAHLDSITRSIRRHGQNKGNRRRRFLMTDEDMRAGTDVFLERNGPPTVDIPFHRDNYYMLEAFLPNRSWISELQKWVYLPADQHDKDVERALKWHANSVDQQRRQAEAQKP